jgi:hypothetical protein
MQKGPGPNLVPGLFFLLLRLNVLLAEFLELGAQAMPQRTLWTQLFQQGLGFLERFLVDLTASKQLSPASANLLFSKQAKPLAERTGKLNQLAAQRAGPSDPARPCDALSQFYL